MDAIKPVLPLTQPLSLQRMEKEVVVTEGQASFGELLNQAIQNVNDLQKQSESAKIGLITGQVEDIHSVMIASEKASVALQLTMQMRNKVIDAYQEVMRMNI